MTRTHVLLGIATFFAGVINERLATVDHEVWRMSYILVAITLFLVLISYIP